MGSPAQRVFPQRRSQSPRGDRLATSTIRDFDGGWNAIDNDLNLSSKFSTILENMYRSKRGSQSIRYGTRLFSDMENQANTTGNLVDNPLATTNASAVVRVTHASHGFISGHNVTLAGLAATNNIPAVELNATHNVTVVTADTYDITVSTNANADGSGGGTSGTYTHNNRNITGNIINGAYFQDRIVGVASDGVVYQIDSNGVSQVVFNTQIANKLVGSPNAWSATTFVSFAVFGGELIICNGVDKPLLADFEVNAPTQPVQYLVDIPSGSNANTPTARYVLAMDHYVLMAGDPANPGLVYISNFDTAGTWSGDAAPNDATNVELDKVITSESAVIRGLGRFRDNVIVGFDDNLVIGNLGLYNASGDHEPAFDDAIEQHGAISHRTFRNLGNDLLSADVFGVPSLARALFTGSIQPQRISELIDPEIQALTDNLSVGSSEDRIFSVYNQKEGQYMLFIPNNDAIGQTTETQCFVYTKIDTLKIKAWSRFRGWNWSCALRSALGRVFFGVGKKFYVYGNDQDQIFGDFVNDYDFFTWNTSTAYTAGQRVRDDATGTVYIALVGHTSAPSGTFAQARTANDALWDEYEGTNVDFTWELPWADFDTRMKIKHNKYIGFDTRGTGAFTAQMFVDNIQFSAVDGTTLDPTLTMDFVGGDSPGFGAGEQPFGGGRRTSDERLWSWPTKFKISKLRISGSTNKNLEFIAVTLAYLDGSIRR